MYLHPMPEVLFLIPTTQKDNLKIDEYKVSESGAIDLGRLAGKFYENTASSNKLYRN